MIVCYPNIHFLSQKYRLHFTDEEIAALKQTEAEMTEQVGDRASSRTRVLPLPTCSPLQHATLHVRESPEYKLLMAGGRVKFRESIRQLNLASLPFNALHSSLSSHL